MRQIETKTFSREDAYARTKEKNRPSIRVCFTGFTLIIWLAQLFSSLYLSISLFKKNLFIRNLIKNLSSGWFAFVWEFSFLQNWIWFALRASETSDTGSQYRCRRVGRGSQPRSTPNTPPNTLSNTDTYTKSFKTLIFLLFDLCSRTNIQTNGRTYGPTDGQGLL